MKKAEQSSNRHFWNVLDVVLESWCFARETKDVFISIRYRNISQTQDVKSQSTKRSLRSLAQPKRDSAFEQKTRNVPSREISRILKTTFVVTTKENSRAELKQTFLERTERRFGKFLFCSRNKSCVCKYSISQDISNAGCKEPKYQT